MDVRIYEITFESCSIPVHENIGQLRTGRLHMSSRRLIWR